MSYSLDIWEVRKKCILEDTGKCKKEKEPALQEPVKRWLRSSKGSWGQRWCQDEFRESCGQQSGCVLVLHCVAFPSIYSEERARKVLRLSQA